MGLHLIQATNRRGNGHRGGIVVNSLDLCQHLHVRNPINLFQGIFVS